MFLPWLLSAVRLDPPVARRIEDADVGGAADAEVSGVDAEQRRRLRVIRASAAGSATPSSSRPLERERQQQLEAGGARLRFGERHLLAVVVDRRVVGADEVDRAVGERRAQRRAVARRCAAAASGGTADRTSRCRRRTGAGDGSATSQVTGRPSRFAARTMRDAFRASTAGTGARARRCRAPARGSSRARSSRPPPESPAGRGASRPRRRARRRPCARCGSCGAQPDAVAEGRRVLHRAQQHLRVDERRVGLRERDAAGLGELAHFGERRALRARPSARRSDRRAPG